VKVLYVGGYSRSGGTLVGRALGQLPNFVSVGELGYLWKRTLPENRLCGCGAPFLECPFWTEVGRVAFGGWDAIDGPRMIELDRRVRRHRFIPALALGRSAPSHDGAAREHAARYARVYEAVAAVAGNGVVVDSTLDPSFAFLLSRAAELEVGVVHLVRDSRGTAFSWTKRIPRPDVTGPPGYLRTYRPASTAVRWTLDHSLFHLLGALAGRQILVRYESFVSRPAHELRRIAAYAGEDVADDDLAFVGSDSLRLGTDHTVAGNRMRFRRGDVPLELDDEWRTALAVRDRRLVTAITWPLLRAYGYTRANGYGASVTTS
jgi:hypothetical protein